MQLGTMTFVTGVQLRGKRESETEEVVFAEAWACRELLQRAIDGPDTSDAACAAGLDEYELLPGPNMPVPGGYSVRKLHKSQIDILTS